MQPDPADIFKGKITMGGRPLEEADVSREERTAEETAKNTERVPFAEAPASAGTREDEDVFIRHGENAFDDPDLFPMKRRGRRKPGRENRRCLSYPTFRISLSGSLGRTMRSSPR